MTMPVLGGRYRLIRRLGRGGMGEVWLAQDELLDRQVAIKRLLTGSGPSEPAGPEDLSRLLREARLAARLNHPNAVSVFDVVLDNQRPDVVMEYVPGDTLADKIKRRGALPVEEVRRIGAAIADALAEAHRLGIVHRDLKPANVLVTDRGVPKLADFGIARLGSEGTGYTITGFMLGTPAFLAPEVARGEAADARSDVWSLGITLYAALEGRSPFQIGPADNTLAVLSRVVTTTAPPPPRGGPLTPAIMRMIRADPSARPSAQDAAALLRAASASTPPPLQWASPPAAPGPPIPPRPAYWPTNTPPMPTPPPGPPRHPPTQHPRSRVGWLVAGFVALLAAIIGIVVAVRTSGGGGPTVANTSTATATFSTSSSTSSSASSTSGSPNSGGITTTESVDPASSSASGSPTPDLTEQRYSGPGGITVIGPFLWSQDTSAGIANVRDFRAPGSIDRDSGSYFRLGIGNPKPAANIHDEVVATVRTLDSASGAYSDLAVVKVTYFPYQGTQGADVEFKAKNSGGILRHVKVRLWIVHGHTLEIELNAPDTLYSLYSGDVYPRLVSTCVVKG